MQETQPVLRHKCWFSQKLVKASEWVLENPSSVTSQLCAPISWGHVLESIRVRGHESSHPKRLVGSWTVFLTAESTGWITADPHPEYRTDWLVRSPWFTCTVTPPGLFGLLWNFSKRGDDRSQHKHPQHGAEVMFGRSWEDFIAMLSW